MLEGDISRGVHLHASVGERGREGEGERGREGRARLEELARRLARECGAAADSHDIVRRLGGSLSAPLLAAVFVAKVETLGVFSDSEVDALCKDASRRRRTGVKR